MSRAARSANAWVLVRGALDKASIMGCMLTRSLLRCRTLEWSLDRVVTSFDTSLSAKLAERILAGQEYLADVVQWQNISFPS
jgi:hypothetical protein